MAKKIKTPDQLKDNRVTVRFSDAEYAAIQAIADQTGMKLSDIVRRAVSECQVNVINIDTGPVNRELRKIGNNVNQLAKHFNTGLADDYRQQDGERLLGAFDQVYDLFSKIRKDISGIHRIGQRPGGSDEKII